LVPNAVVVTTTLDGTIPGQTSLRNAITQFNQQNGLLNVTFAANVQGQTITLDPTLGTLDVTGNGELIISGGTQVTIQRSSNAQQAFGLFQAGPLTTLELVNLTLTGGSSGAGGAVFSAGDLIVEDCTIDHCTAGVSGGAIAFSGSYLSVTGSTITANTAGSFGGGIVIAGQTSDISNSTISCNSAQFGGGISINGAKANVQPTVTLNNVDVVNNGALDWGGGIYADSGTPTNLTLAGGTTIDTNWCTDPVVANQAGGGIYFGAGTLTLNGVWIGDNTANQGSGLYQLNQGTTVVIGQSGVTWYMNQETVGPPIVLGPGNS
jgi:hypothetical protein